MRAVDSCYVCEIGKDGLIVQVDGREVLVCSKCVLECIFSHPKLVQYRE